MAILSTNKKKQTKQNWAKFGDSFLRKQGDFARNLDQCRNLAMFRPRPQKKRTEIQDPKWTRKEFCVTSKYLLTKLLK
jgi:hypothetical protein